MLGRRQPARAGAADVPGRACSQRQDSLSAVVEWQSPSFAETYGRAFLVLVLVAVAALVRRPSWRAAVPLVVFLAAGLIATRNLPVAALVMMPGIARGAGGLGGLTGRAPVAGHRGARRRW